MRGDLPTGFVIGAPKCGTTALAEYLSSNPEIAVSVPKEPFYFGSDLKGFRSQQGVTKRDEYLGCFKPAQLMVDASTLYLASKDAIQQVVELIPDPRFLVCTRPIASMATSWALHLKRYGFELPGEPPERWVLDVERVCAVADQLDRLQQLVDPSFVCLIRQTSLISDPSRVVGSAERFLGLVDSIREEPIRAARSNPTQMPRSRAIFDLLQNPRARQMASFAKRRMPARSIANARVLKDRLLFDRDRVPLVGPCVGPSFIADQQRRLDSHLSDDRWGLVL